MKRKSLVMTAAAMLLAASAAAVTATSAFINAPRQVVPMIDSLTRLDMIDYFVSGLETPSTNALGGNSRVTALDDEMVSFITTEASRRDIIMLPSGRDTVIAVITTIMLPTPDSTIDFYTADWRPASGKKYFTVPSVKDWLTEAGRRNRQPVDDALQFMTASYEYSPEEAILTLTNNVGGVLSREDSTAVAPLMKHELRYRWNCKKFSPLP